MTPVRLSRVIDDEACAACPFIVTSITTRSYEPGNNSSKKRKRGNQSGTRKLTQKWPFGLSGDFGTQIMDVSYTVKPRKEWLDMTRYNSFVLYGIKYYSEDFVYIANGGTVARQKTANEDPDQANMVQLTDHWVARILEIRALDEHHVYARVYWMYSPEELPPNTVVGGTLVSEQQTHYGQNELIASNHMDIINVVSVVKRAIVNEPVDAENALYDGAMYWRQAFDCRDSELFSADETDESRSSKPSEVSTVEPDTEEERTYAVLSTSLSERETNTKQSPLDAKVDMYDDYVRAKQLDANTNRTAEIPGCSTEYAGALSGKNLRPGSVERDSHDCCSGSTQMSAVEHSVPQMAAVAPIASKISRMSTGPLLPSPACADSLRTPSGLTAFTSTATASRALSAEPLMSPVYLPSKSQHALLTYLQDSLEISCYEFGKRVMPDILQRRGWDCAESVELNRWTDEFQRQKSFSAAEHARKPLKMLFRSVANIRHSAVHRRKVSVKGIEQFLLDAEAFAMLLGDAERSEKISTLRQEIQVTIKELDRYRVLFYARLGENLGLRGNKRAQLHHTEELEFAAMEREQKEYLREAGRRLEEAIASSAVCFPSVAGAR